jgi:hypothetical protein
LQNESSLAPGRNREDEKEAEAKQVVHRKNSQNDPYLLPAIFGEHKGSLD